MYIEKWLKFINNVHMQINGDNTNDCDNTNDNDNDREDLITN